MAQYERASDGYTQPTISRVVVGDHDLKSRPPVGRIDDRRHGSARSALDVEWLRTARPEQPAGSPAPAKRFLPPLENGCIQGDGLVLTHPLASDLEALCLADHDALTREHAIFPPVEPEAMRAQIELAPHGWHHGDATFLVARLVPEGEPVAKISVRRLVPPGVLDVGYSTMVGHRGHHYAARALRLFTEWAFRVACIQRIELGIKPANTPSVRTAIRAGYVLESVRRSRLANLDGTFDDEHSYVAVNADRHRGWEGTV